MAEQGQGDTPLHAAAGVAVSTARVATSAGTFAVRQISSVRAKYTHGGRGAGAVLVVAGVLLGAGAAWIGSDLFLGAAAVLSLAVGIGAMLVRPTGYLYLTPTGAREQLVARGTPEEVSALVAAVEHAMRPPA